MYVCCGVLRNKLFAEYIWLFPRREPYFSNMHMGHNIESQKIQQGTCIQALLNKTQIDWYQQK